MYYKFSAIVCVCVYGIYPFNIRLLIPYDKKQVHENEDALYNFNKFY